MTVLAVIGNVINVELFFGVNFLFGSIFTIIALMLFGTLGGLVVAIVAGAYTISLWGHSYALVIFVLEALFVGVYSARLKSPNVLLADMIFWIIIGMPLVWVFYSYGLDLPTQIVWLIMLKRNYPAWVSA